MGIVRIRGDIAGYDWGGPGAISKLFGWPHSTEPEAEWWLGTHPLRPSHLESGEPLSQWLAKTGGDSLPYLFKVLAPVKPLSLQVHPSPEQARAGFAAEEQAGVPLDAPERMFKDEFSKPELVVAVKGPFHILAGLRPAADTVLALRGLYGDEVPPGIAAWLDALEHRPLAEVIEWLLRSEGDAALVPGELAERASADDTLTRLTRHYPGDPGIAVGLMMHRITLNPGEAAFLDAGQLHAYLEGFAIELMAPSDNVLRGGLTPKHVDVDALLAIADFAESDPPILQRQALPGGGWRYQPVGQAWGLGLLEGDAVEAHHPLHGTTLVVCTSGEWLVSGESEQLTLQPGEALVVSAEENTLRLSGSGQLWWAGAE